MYPRTHRNVFGRTQIFIELLFAEDCEADLVIFVVPETVFAGFCAWIGTLCHHRKIRKYTLRNIYIELHLPSLYMIREHCWKQKHSFLGKYSLREWHFGVGLDFVVELLELMVGYMHFLDHRRRPISYKVHVVVLIILHFECKG